MLLEMQSAMNNMMNNSQLHASSPPVPSSQTQPVPTKPTAHALPSFSPAASPQSSQSELSNDPEPSLPMDTSPSSNSSSATDSGEEELIGTGTRPGPEAERVMDDAQEVWNHHNNLATVTHQHPCLHYSPQDPHEAPQEDNSLSCCPVKVCNSASSGQCHVQLLANTDLSHPCSASVVGQPLQAHNSNGTRANASYTGPVWSGGNRMHLVSTSKLSDVICQMLSHAFDTWGIIFKTVCCLLYLGVSHEHFSLCGPT